MDGRVTSTTFAAATARPAQRMLRWALAAAGVACVGVGAVGVVVPGLPTTVFLIAAAWCFARSCPWLEAKLVRCRLFAPFLGYLDRTAPMPRRARIAAIGTMWLFVAIAIWSLGHGDAGPAPLGAALAAAACVGTVVIARWDAPARHRR